MGKRRHLLTRSVSEGERFTEIEFSSVLERPPSLMLRVTYDSAASCLPDRVREQGLDVLHQVQIAQFFAEQFGSHVADRA